MNSRQELHQQPVSDDLLIASEGLGHGGLATALWHCRKNGRINASTNASAGIIGELSAMSSPLIVA